MREPKHLVLFLILLCFAFVSAQANDEADEGERRVRAILDNLQSDWLAWVAGTDAWITLAPGAAVVTVQDTRMSSLIYTGPGAGATLTDVVVRDRWLWPTTVSAVIAFPQGPAELPGVYQTTTATLSSVFLWRLGSPTAGLAVGGGLRGGASVRIYDKLSNSAFNVDVVVSLVASARYELPFSLGKRRLSWISEAHVSAFSFVGRSPEYTLYGFAPYWLWPWRFPRTALSTGLAWNMRWSNENRAELSYEWDFYALNETGGLHQLRVATHTLVLGLGLKRM